MTPDRHSRNVNPDFRTQIPVPFAVPAKGARTALRLTFSASDLRRT